jgi:DNA-binding MarR family transcriptional regulator
MMAAATPERAARRFDPHAAFIPIAVDPKTHCAEEGGGTEVAANTVNVQRSSLGTPLNHVLSEIHPVLNRALNRSWPAAPLTPSQARLLRVVRLRPGISTGELPQELHEDPRFAKTLVDQLVRLDLLADGPDPEDPHRNALRLTAQGQLRTHAWRMKSTETLDRALDELTSQERAAIAVALPALEHLADVLAGS